MMLQYPDFDYLREEIADSRKRRAAEAETEAKAEAEKTKQLEADWSPLKRALVRLLAGNLSYFDTPIADTPKTRFVEILANWQSESLTYGHFFVTKPQLAVFVHFYTEDYYSPAKLTRLLMIAGFEFSSLVLPDKKRTSAMKIAVPPASQEPSNWRAGLCL